MYQLQIKQRPEIFDRVKYLQNKLNSVTESNKQKYYSGLSKTFILYATDFK